jgi:hypothetical protein
MRRTEVVVGKWVSVGRRRRMVWQERERAWCYCRVPRRRIEFLRKVWLGLKLVNTGVV